MKFAKNISIAFSAGCVGALVKSVLVWLAATYGAAQLLGVTIKTPSGNQFYHHLVWGGIWGLMFVLPFIKTTWWKRGLFFGIFPALTALFVFVPWKSAAGTLQLSAGTLTILTLLLLNWAWGLATAAWYENLS